MHLGIIQLCVGMNFQKYLSGSTTCELGRTTLLLEADVEERKVCIAQIHPL
jgi:hypothetical protein